MADTTKEGAQNTTAIVGRKHKTKIHKSKAALEVFARGSVCSGGVCLLLSLLSLLLHVLMRTVL
jgi:hypothetical protein